MRQQRCIGCDHNNDRTRFLLVNVAGNLLANWDSSNCELRAASAIGLNESADCIGASRTGFILHFDHARGSPGSAFELVTDHPGPAADASLFDWATVGRLECVPDVVWFNVKAINVVEPAVPSLGHHRQAPPVSGLIGCPMLD